MGLISRVSSRTYRLKNRSKSIMTVEEQKRVFEAQRVHDDGEDEEDDEDEDEEEMIDPLDLAREDCNKRPAGVAFAAEMPKCTERVEADEETEETCTQELFDFLKHRDECVKSKFSSIVKFN